MDETETRLHFRTDKYLQDTWYGDRSLKVVEVFPFESPWNFTLLTCFLNEHGNFKKAERRPYQNTNDAQKFTFEYKEIENLKIYVKIQENTISITMSTEYIRRLWRSNNTVEMTKMGVGRKILVRSSLKTFIFYDIVMNTPRDGTKALFHHTPLIFSSLYDFSDIFHFFAKKINHFPISDDTVSLSEYIDCWIKTKKEKITNISTLEKSVHGYLKLNVQPMNSSKKLARILTKVNEIDTQCYITSGVFVSSWAKSLIHDNTDLIQGFILDTTWKIMPFYVTSILMGSAHNTGIPLAFAFGNSEDRNLYLELLNTFQQTVDYNIRGKVILSDQGSALKSAISELKMIHLACLRHLLVALKFNRVTYLFGELIKSASDVDYKTIKKQIEESFKEVNDNKTKELLKQTLNKTGLKHVNGEISFADEERWDSISIKERIKYRMPSTSNSLESTHGHLNKKTPRHNNFYTSLHRIIMHMMLKTQRIEQCIHINYMKTKAETSKSLKSTSQERMNDEISHYSSTPEKCECGQNKLLSAILNIPIPCRHQCALGATFPPCPVIRPKVCEQWSKLVIEMNILPPEEATEMHDELYYDKKYAFDQIKRFSHYKKTEEIRDFVEKHYTYDGTIFLGKKPISVIQLITQGIEHFSDKLRKENKNEE